MKRTVERDRACLMVGLVLFLAALTALAGMKSSRRPAHKEKILTEDTTKPSGKSDGKELGGIESRQGSGWPRTSVIVAVSLMAISIIVGIDAYGRYANASESPDSASEEFVAQDVKNAFITPLVASNKKGVETAVRLAAYDGGGVVSFSALDSAESDPYLDITVTLPEMPSEPRPLVGLILDGSAWAKEVAKEFSSKDFRILDTPDGQVILAQADQENEDTGQMEAVFLIRSIGRFALCNGSRCWYKMPSIEPPCYVRNLNHANGNLHAIDGPLSAKCGSPEARVEGIRYLSAGWLPLSAHVEWTDPPTTSENYLNWKLQGWKHLDATAEVVDAAVEKANQRDLFVSAIELGLITALIPWAASLWLESYRSRHKRPDRSATG